MGYSETCYSKGIRIVLWVDQNQTGKWICNFAVPRLMISGTPTFQNSASGEYLTEGQAKKAAFESAKKVLADSQDFGSGPDPGAVTSTIMKHPAERLKNQNKRPAKG